MNLDQPATREALESFLAEAAGAGEVRLERWTRLAGGAIQENLLIECVVQGGAHAGHPRWVLRTDAASGVVTSRSRADEFALLQAAWRNGARVPQPLFARAGDDRLPPCFVMTFCEGIAAGHRLTKEGAIADPAGLLRDIGASLARIHAIRPPQPLLGFLGTPTATPTRDFLLYCRDYLDHWYRSGGDAHPALERGIHWWLERVDAKEPVCLVHNDFRVGNLLVANDRLGAVLDWEFAGWGNPLVDLGWFCAPCWRFARRQCVGGGIGRAADLLAGYNDVAGTTWRDVDLVRWQALAQIRWAVIAIQQAERHISGREPSLELALTGRLLPELELDLLTLIKATPR